MSNVVIRVENLSKEYRLGTISGRTLHEDLARWWAKWRGKPDPSLKIGQVDHGNHSGEQIWALKDVSFEVKQGEVLGIIGRNGAGKSTLLKVLSQVTVPTFGEVKTKGRIASLLEVGTGFHPELTGRENIYLNGAILGMRKHEITRKFGEIVDFSGVEQFVDTPVKRYSSGMYVRLAFAVAAHLEPEILIVDEVLAVGDVDFQNKCLGKMNSIATEEGRTVILVSHNMEAIDRLTSTCVWLHQGIISGIGSTQSIVKKYLSERMQLDTDLCAFRVSSIADSAIISDVWTEDTSTNRTSSFRQGEQFRIMLKVKSEIRLPLDAAIVIENVKQQALFTTHLTDHYVPINETGSFVLTAELEKPILRRGQYLVSLALFSPNTGTFYDVIHHFPLFEVSGTLDLHFPDDIRWGDLYLPIKWRVS